MYNIYLEEKRQNIKDDMNKKELQMKKYKAKFNSKKNNKNIFSFYIF